MSKFHRTAASILVLFWVCLASPLQAQEAPKTPKPLEDIQDILAWKSIRSDVISFDGTWFGYRLTPTEGDTEVIFKQIRGEKEFRFPAGEPSGFTSGDVAFSADGRWAAFTIYPAAKEAKAAKTAKKKLFNKVGLIDLSSGDKIDFENIKGFGFSNDNPRWLALHKNAPEGQAEGKEAWKGSDFILYEMASEKTLNIGNVSEFAFNKAGTQLAWLVDAHKMSGNGVYLRNMKTAVIQSLDTDQAVYSRLNWTEEGDGLAVLKGREDKAYKDKLYGVIGFTDLHLSEPAKTVYDPGSDELFPENMTVSPNRTPLWTEDLSALLFGIHEVEKKDEPEKSDEDSKTGETSETQEPGKDAEEKAPPKKKPDAEIDKDDLPGLVIWHWKDRRLQSMQQVQENRDKNFSYLALFRVKEKKFIRLADDEVREVTPAPKHRWAIGQDRLDYELTGNLEGRRYADIYVIDMTTGERKLALNKCRWYMSPSLDGTHFLFYEDGHFHTYEMATGQSRNITKDMPTSFINTEDDHNVDNPPISPFAWGWTAKSDAVLLYDNWDIWKVPVHGGPGQNLTVDGKEKGIRYRNRIRLDPEEKGVDLSKPIYVSPYGEWTKKGGIGVIENGKPGVKTLLWDDASFSLSKARDAEIYIYTRQNTQEFPDFYASDSSLRKGARLTEANPQQKEFLWSSGARLIDYESAKGDKLQAALLLPAGYEEGKSYPTIVYIYEKLSQGLNRYYAPSARGFSQSVYTSRGYAVLMPDIVYTVNDPGMSSVWCVLPAIEAAAAAGVVDRDRVGIHGHSWGGYQSSFLVTQTDIFKACVTGAPLTNMISMYSSIYWNSGSANQPIFESSQGRFYGGYWDNLEAYTRNSPVYFAGNVKTPLIILHNDKDGAVDWNQGIEYFNTLRRLEKPVVMLQYKGENHGLRIPANQKDYTLRMREFFDHHLQGKPAPAWWTEGISHLDHEKHIKETTKRILNTKESKDKEAKK